MHMYFDMNDSTCMLNCFRHAFTSLEDIIIMPGKGVCLSVHPFIRPFILLSNKSMCVKRKPTGVD